MSYEGKVVLNYKLTKKLGEGGFGAVYLAEQVDLGRRAAIKILHHQFASQPQVVERFFREARAVCEIGHRAIVAVENFGRLPETDEPFYLMEFFPGASLTQITSQRWLTSEQLIAILDPIADALVAAHAKQIIHRDLKPDNIMVRITDERVADVRLLDFGIAKLLDSDAAKSMTGSAMGTPSYMPPEQALDAKHVDVRADVYSFGATVFAGVCGRPPFDGDSVAAILLAVQQQTAPVMSTLRPDVPAGLDAAIRRCLAKQREHRPASIGDAWSAIRAELVRANLTPAPRYPNPLVAPTVQPTGAVAARTPSPMRPVTPLPVASPQDTPAAPSAITPVPATIKALPAQVAIGADQAATTPEVRPKSKLPIVLGIAGLVVAGTVTAIVVAKSMGSKSDAPIAAVDAAVAVADAALAMVDAAPMVVDAVPTSIDAAITVADAAPEPRHTRLDRDRATNILTAALAEIATDCGNRPSRTTTTLTFHISLDHEGVVTAVGVQGEAKIGDCMKAALQRRQLGIGPSLTGGGFAVSVRVASDAVANPKPPDPKPDPKLPEPKPAPACSVSVLDEIAKKASTTADISNALARLNQCAGKIPQTDFLRIQGGLIARQ